MASTILYPPIVQTYAVPVTQEAENIEIPFDLSQFNSLSQIGAIQVKVTDIATNFSILDPKEYPRGIYQINKIGKPEEFYKRTITLKKSLFKDNNNNLFIFPLNIYYKVQLRFIDSNQASVITPNNADTIEYSPFVSEWSTSILFRVISTPKIVIEGVNDIGTLQTEESLISIKGFLTFEDQAEKDLLKAYKISIPDLYETDILNVNTYNRRIDCFIPKELQVTEELKEKTYKDCTLTYYTTAGYVGEYKFNITYTIPKKQNNNPFKYKFLAIPFENKSCIRIKANLSLLKNEEMNGQMAIKRKSQSLWEEIISFNLELSKSDSNALEEYDFYYDDYTVEDYKLYKYRITIKQENNILLEEDLSEVMLDSTGSFLIADNKILRLLFDTNISSYKYNVQESTQATLGSVYPVVRRNGNTNYRTFSLSGKISFLGDLDNYNAIKGIIGKSSNIKEDENISSPEYSFLFLNEEEQMSQMLQDYCFDNNLMYANNYIYEKIFRDKVIEFLQKNNIKLFKSPSEGNMLVRLSNISFTPNKTLDRAVWDFSATATEVAVFSLENFKKLNVIPKQYKVAEYVLPIYKKDDAETVTTLPANISFITEGGVIYLTALETLHVEEKLPEMVDSNDI